MFSYILQYLVKHSQERIQKQEETATKFPAHRTPDITVWFIAPCCTQTSQTEIGNYTGSH